MNPQMNALGWTSLAVLDAAGAVCIGVRVATWWGDHHVTRRDGADPLPEVLAAARVTDGGDRR